MNQRQGEGEWEETQKARFGRRKRMNTEALERLRAFRQEMYTTFGCRRDALVEMLDALLTSPVIEHPVQSPPGPHRGRVGSRARADKSAAAPGRPDTRESCSPSCELPSTWGVNRRLRAAILLLSYMTHLVVPPPPETGSP